MAKTGRPKKEIDQDRFEKLCGLQCTKEDICDFFGVTDKTIDAWCKRTYKESFSVVFKQKRGKGKCSLRRYQFALAQKTQIWQFGSANSIWGRKTSLNSRQTAGCKS